MLPDPPDALSGTRGEGLKAGTPRPRRVNVVLRFDAQRPDALRGFLQEGGFRLEGRPNALFFATRPGVSLTAYASGKLLVTGAQAEEYAGVLAARRLAQGTPAAAKPTDTARHAAPPFAAHVGADESGKGDYFGPLVVAAVLVPDADTARELEAKGVRDSKLVTTTTAGPLASLVRARCPFAVRALAPPRYNDVYARYGSLNFLLAAMHAENIEDLLGQTGPHPVVIDQFAHEKVLATRLGPRAREAGVTQAVRAESDIAVAAASLVARAEFLAGIAALSAQHGVMLPRGAGAPVVAAAKAVARQGGEPMLRQVAKVHFATTRSALG